MDHQNIVTVFDYGETKRRSLLLGNGVHFQQSFSRLAEARPTPGSRAVGLVIQVAKALRYAHKRGVVHRDVKNSNVLVRTLDNEEEQAKVVDFGLVKLSRMDTGLTQTGMILGSLISCHRNRRPDKRWTIGPIFMQRVCFCIVA